MFVLYLLANRQLTLNVFLNIVKLLVIKTLKHFFSFVGELVTVAVTGDAPEICVYGLETVISK